MSTAKIVRELRSAGAQQLAESSALDSQLKPGSGKELRGPSAVPRRGSLSSESQSELFLQFRSNRKLNLAPFLCDLSTRSTQFDDATGAMRFVDFSVQGTLAFIDISGYSKTAAYLAAKGGAHALAEAVNSYLEPIIDVVLEHQGDIIKFAGDAVVAMWHRSSEEENCRLAVNSAQALLKLPEKPIADGLSLALHIGISCGTFQSAVLCPRSHVKASVMQQAFHYLAGQPLNDISDVVDGAKRGEFRVTKEVAEALRTSFEFQPAEGSSTYALVKAIPSPSTGTSTGETGETEESKTNEELDTFEAMAAVAELPDFEERFVPPAVSSRLKAGLRLMQMAEMRHLFILFIKMADESEDSREWFEEVHAVLEGNGCPITQLIHDDKGFHVIGAVNLYVGDSEGPRTTIRIVQQLQERGIKCITGVAGGVCFCGIVGSETKCRWDITGDPCVRACRLMQFAEANDVSCIFDLSVHEQLIEKSFLSGYRTEVVIKGTPDPLPVVFTLSTEESSAALSSICGINEFGVNCRLKERLQVQKHLGICPTAADGSPVRAAPPLPSSFLLVIGPPLSGKKTVFLSAVTQTTFVPVMYRARHNAEKVEMCSCIGHWFSLHQDPKIAALATELLYHSKANRSCAAVRLLIEMVLYMVSHGLHTVMVMANVQHLDSATLRMMRQITERVRTLSKSCVDSSGLGSWHWCGTLTPMYGGQSAASMRESFPTDFELSLQPISQFEMQSQLLAWARGAMSEPLLHILTDIAGGSPGLVMAVMKWSAPIVSSDMLQQDSQLRYTCMEATGVLNWSDRGHELIAKFPRTKIFEAQTPRMLSLCDVLPPRQQFILKIVATLCIENRPVTSGCIERVGVAALGCEVEAVREDLRILTQLLILSAKPASPTCTSYTFVFPALADILACTITPKQRKMVCTKGAAAFCEGMNNAGLQNPWTHLHRARIYALAEDKPSAISSALYSWELFLATNPDPKRELPPVLFLDFEHCLTYELTHFLATTQAEIDALFQPRPDSAHQTSATATWYPPRIFAHRHFDMSNFSSIVLDAGLVEPPLVLGPLAGHVRFVVFGLLESVFQAQKSDRPPEPIPAVSLASYMRLTDRVAAIASVPPEDWNEERMRIQMSRSEEAELIEQMVTVVTDVEAGLALSGKVLNYYQNVVLPRSRQVTAWAKYLTGVRISNSADERGPSSSPSHKALVSALQLMLDNHHVRESEKEREPILHRVLMLLAAANWSTKTPYMTPAALRDCILFRWIDWDEVKAILFLHIIEPLPDGATVEVTSATRIKLG